MFIFVLPTEKRSSFIWRFLKSRQPQQIRKTEPPKIVIDTGLGNYLSTIKLDNSFYCFKQMFIL